MNSITAARLTTNQKVKPILAVDFSPRHGYLDVSLTLVDLKLTSKKRYGRLELTSKEDSVPAIFDFTFGPSIDLSQHCYCNKAFIGGHSFYRTNALRPAQGGATEAVCPGPQPQ